MIEATMNANGAIYLLLLLLLDASTPLLHLMLSSTNSATHTPLVQPLDTITHTINITCHFSQLQADLEKCAQERVALDAVAAARKALEAKRFIERQAIRQAMIERATAELLQRTADTDNREVCASTTTNSQVNTLRMNTHLSACTSVDCRVVLTDSCTSVHTQC
jgi:hypothetical protein